MEPFALDPNRVVPSTTELWFPRWIPIYNGPGQVPINVADVFKCAYPAAVKELADSQSIFIFPVEYYPPNWESRATLLDAIIESARTHADTTLIKNRSKKTRNEQLAYLECEKSACYKIPKIAGCDKENESEDWVKNLE